MIKKKNKNKAIFLDRDGTLIYSKKKSKFKIRPPYEKKELKFYKDIKYINKFKKKYIFIIVTNQPDVKRGFLKEEFNNYINTELKKKIPYKKIYMCFQKNSNCYKPKTLMVNKAIKKFNINTNESFIIGDTWRDIELGNRSNISTILVDRKYPKNLTKIKKTKPEFIIQSFKELGKIIK